MRKKYIQFAFNDTFYDFAKICRYIPLNENIIVEAGTPLIKREGIGVVYKMFSLWPGKICADMKIADGAVEEVTMARSMGAYSVTALGNNSIETLKLFVETCKQQGILSVIDMINNQTPLKSLWKSGTIPDITFIHRGRDEENSYGKLIQYKEIAKIKGKYNTLVGAAGGIDKRELQSAIFNNADIVVVNVVKPGSQWKGITIDDTFGETIGDFLRAFK